MARVAVVGAGQPGCQLALGLLRHGLDVTLIARSNDLVVVATGPGELGRLFPPVQESGALGFLLGGS